jgi:hypothetical protein
MVEVVEDGDLERNFFGDFAVYAVVPSTEEQTHPAAADYSDDAVVGKSEPLKGV